MRWQRRAHCERARDSCTAPIEAGTPLAMPICTRPQPVSATTSSHATSWGGRGGVEAGTLRFDEGVAAVLSQQLIQPTIEGMTRGRRQVRRRHPHRRLSVACSFAHRHGRRVVRFSRMSKLIYITNASLDGYIEDKTGAFDWGNPDQVFDFITELMRPIGTHLLGRRLYETMAHWDGPLEDYPPEHRDFGARHLHWRRRTGSTCARIRSRRRMSPVSPSGDRGRPKPGIPNRHTTESRIA